MSSLYCSSVESYASQRVASDNTRAVPSHPMLFIPTQSTQFPSRSLSSLRSAAQSARLASSSYDTDSRLSAIASNRSSISTTTMGNGLLYKWEGESGSLQRAVQTILLTLECQTTTMAWVSRHLYFKGTSRLELTYACTDHKCGTCATVLSSPRAKKTCLGVHEEVCIKYHKTLFFLGKSQQWVLLRGPKGHADRCLLG